MERDRTPGVYERRPTRHRDREPGWSALAVVIAPVRPDRFAAAGSPMVDGAGQDRPYRHRRQDSKDRYHRNTARCENTQPTIPATAAIATFPAWSKAALRPSAGRARRMGRVSMSVPRHSARTHRRPSPIRHWRRSPARKSVREWRAWCQPPVRTAQRRSGRAWYESHRMGDTVLRELEKPA